MTALLAQGLVAGARYALLAYGFGLVYATTGIFHFAHGAAYAIAGYVAWLAHARLDLPFVAAAALAVLTATALGWAVEVWLYRPLRHRRAPADVLFLTSLGVFTIATNALALVWGQDTQALNLPSRGYELLPAAGNHPPLVLTTAQLATVGVAVGLFLGLWLLLTRTQFGLAVRAVAANPALAEARGLSSDRILPRVVALGAALAAAAALCVAADVGVSPQMGLEAVVASAVAVVVGGLGSLPGTALAGLLLGLLRHAAAYTIGSRWEDLLTFALLLLVLLVRPRGLFGRRDG